MNMEKQLAHSLARAEWETVCAEWGFPKFRAAQIWQGVHAALAETWDAVRGLPAELRAKLDAAYELRALEVVETTGTGTRKLLLKCRDGHCVEAVLIPSSGRNTLCVSSQIGCAFGCAFCASGAKGCERRPAGRVANPKPLAEYDPDEPYFQAMYDLGDAG